MIDGFWSFNRWFGALLGACCFEIGVKLVDGSLDCWIVVGLLLGSGIVHRVP